MNCLITYKELKKQFANISREVIKLFIQLCEQCILKKKRSETSKLIVRPITSSDFNSQEVDDICSKFPTIVTL
jgi:hypothetical protein